MVMHLGTGRKLVPGEAELDLPSRGLGDPQGLAGQESWAALMTLGFSTHLTIPSLLVLGLFLGEWRAGLCVALLLLSFFFFNPEKAPTVCVKVP